MNAYRLQYTWQNHAKSFARSWIAGVEVYTPAVEAVWISNIFWLFSPTSALYGLRVCVCVQMIYYNVIQ